MVFSTTIFKPCSGEQARKYRRTINAEFFSTTVLASAVSRTIPIIKSFALVILAQPYIVGIFIAFCQEEKSTISKKNLLGFVGYGAVAMTSWVLDMTACQWLKHSGIPFFHSLCHILSAHMLCYAFNFCVHHNISNFSGQVSSSMIRLSFMPNIPILGVPYIEIVNSPDASKTFFEEKEKMLQQSTNVPESPKRVWCSKWPSITAKFGVRCKIEPRNS